MSHSNEYSSGLLESYHLANSCSGCYVYLLESSQNIIGWLRHCLNESVNETCDVSFRLDMMEDKYVVAEQNLNGLCKSILALSTKPNGEPLNQDMVQIIELVKQTLPQHRHDISQIDQKYQEKAKTKAQCDKK